jgi:NhaA family Na+:H+ antiporter
MNRPSAGDDNVQAPLEKAAQTLTEPFRDFVRSQSASGWLLLVATLLAVGIANSSWASTYFDILNVNIGVSVDAASLELTLQHWVNDGLMALFFFLLGLELKRELLVGQLSDFRRATSVLLAALGGMILPALLFLAIGHSGAVRAGWAIPIATDTAFALTLLVLLGHRVPGVARAFLVGLAIVDDLGAILVIALAYSSEFDFAYLAPAIASLLMLFGLNLAGVRRGLPYLLVGMGLWLTFVGLGLHGTLAGVVVAMAAPVRPAIARNTFVQALKQRLQKFEDKHQDDTDTIIEQPEQQEIAQDVVEVAAKATAPLPRWESRLERPVSFVVMPLFAFMNAGIVLSGAAIRSAWSSELSYAVAAGLLLGKPVGILAGVWVGQRVNLAALPEALSSRHLIGLGLLGGIGFTMSMFIATLSFGEGGTLLDIAKQSIIATSLFAGCLGYAWLRWVCPRAS